MLHKAKYFKKDTGDDVVCLLCPHGCNIANGDYGVCGVRKNVDGELYATTYNKISVLSTDPIEKKSLYHFFPGKDILSLSSIGCNLNCQYCQNCDIPRATPEKYSTLKTIDEEYLLDILFAEENTIGISYTYNEPIIWIESLLNIAQKIKIHGFVNVIVSNGYINKEPLEQLCDYVDAFNIDLKAFTEDYYRDITSSSLEPVLETLKRIKEREKHLEISYLVIPGLNDDIKVFTKMLEWIQKELGSDVVLHLNKYFPGKNIKIEPTPDDLLNELYSTACKYLEYAYIGNINHSIGRDTFCPSCNERVLRRVGFYSVPTGLNTNGDCMQCKQHVISHL